MSSKITVPAHPGEVAKVVVPVTSGEQFQVTIHGSLSSGLVMLREPGGDSVRFSSSPSGSDSVVVNFQATWSGAAILVLPASTTGLDLSLQRRSGGVLLDRWESDSTVGQGPLAGSLPVSRTLHPGDDDFFRIPGASDSEFVVRILGKARGTATILDSDGKTVRTLSIPDSAGVATSIRYKTGSSTSWGLRIESNSLTDTGAYTVTVSGRYVLPFDPWECSMCVQTSESPDTLTIGRKGPIRSLRKEDLDRSTFLADSGKMYVIRAFASHPISFVAYPPNGNGYTGSSSAEFAELGSLVVAEKSGWVIIETKSVNPKDSGTFSYEVSLAPSVDKDANEPNDSRELATAIAVDSALHAGSFTGSDNDWYVFDADSGAFYEIDLFGQVSITVTPTEAGTGDYIGSSGTNPGNTLAFHAKRKGKLRFLLTSRFPGRYGFRLQKVANPPQDLAEPDDSRSQARIMPTDSTPQLRRMEPQGSDWFRMEVEKGLEYRLFDDQEIRNLQMTLWDTAQSILSKSSSCVFNVCYQRFVAPYTGTVYLEVKPQTWAVFPYTLAVKGVTTP